MKTEKNMLKEVNPYIWNESYKKCLLWFFDYPYTETGLNDLSASLSMAKTTVRRIVLKLESEGFLAVKKLGKIWRIACNKEHNYNKTLKIFMHLEMLSSTNFLEKIYEILPDARAIILFGSYRKGDDTEKSDIDIAVEVLGNKNLEIREIGRANIGFRKNIAVNLHIFSRSKVDINLFSNIANGIVLDGFLEVKP